MQERDWIACVLYANSARTALGIAAPEVVVPSRTAGLLLHAASTLRRRVGVQSAGGRRRRNSNLLCASAGFGLVPN
jgi:hypothetical protein